MTKLKNNINTQRDWLDWCRLCASENANINVRQKDVYMRIISKCFDIEIGLEEPELGALLCRNCYVLIDELVNFAENVNKVQPIFELLRHTEPNEQVDVFALRQEYGLQDGDRETAYKVEPADAESSRENSLHRELYFDEVDSNKHLDQTLTQMPTPVKRKRGRPRGSKNRTVSSCGSLQIQTENIKLEATDDLHEDLSSTYEGGDHIWLDDCNLEEEGKTLNGAINRKHGRPKLSLKLEPLDKWEEPDAFNLPAVNSTAEAQKLRLKQLNASKDEIYNSGQTIIKRKRGRPRKNDNENGFIKVHDESVSKCKNVALARLLLTSPRPDAEVDAAAPECIPNIKQFMKCAATCNICHKELSSENGLRYHIERVHMKKKPFVCDVCGKRVRTVSELKEHMLVHTDDRPFVCPICGAAFKNKKRLNIHNQTHGEPSYECEICGKKLQTRAIWNKHKNVHTNERRFKCSICGTATKNSTALKIHLLSHTGLRPYSCKYCNKDFASGANCRDHKIRKHPLEYEQDADKSCRIQSVPTLDELRALAAGMEKGERLRKPKTLITE
ncbi:zinc finger protein weckle [Drosophila mojavensis]|uniref:Zinc finger protein weckle n=1 Tax=Drosophila mojavensis TaxID=7230 RepID=B4K7N7_DROMO|nr:zinc finger protein weckle [Drosophila mojavensis]EDW16408.2 uncharacterized protein Dmoj_GI22250 [Drosophila mojavensis]